MIYRILSILICGVFSIGCLTQRVKTVGGEYTYVAPKNMSPEEAERVAFERLKTKLIAEEFGTVVSQTNLTKVENQNGQSNIDFSSYGGSEVKGEWIETVKGPHFEKRICRWTGGGEGVGQRQDPRDRLLQGGV